MAARHIITDRLRPDSHQRGHLDEADGIGENYTTSFEGPLLYVWIVGTVAVLSILGVSMTVGGSLMSNGSFFDVVIGYQIIKGGFRRN